MLACSAAPLFYARPFLAPPMFDGLFVALASALFWPVTGPVQEAENLPHMTRMVADAEFTLDDLRHSFAGP